MKFLIFFSLTLISLIKAEIVQYDSFSNAILTAEEVAAREAAGNSYYCVNSLDTACNANEKRRIDGSCNNLNYPNIGTQHSQFLRFLPSVFNGSEPRTAADGKPLPNPRALRTQLLAEGRINEHKFTQTLFLFLAFSLADISAMTILDSVNYLVVHKTCCTAEGATDEMCAPISVPANDPVHQFSGITCMNLTRPISFQSTGCVAEKSPPHRLNYGTPYFDLSMFYGNSEDIMNTQRLFTGGLLNFTMRGDKQWPRYVAQSVARRDGIEGLTGINFPFALWIWREHNRIATKLQSINPCWTDDQLFFTTRDIMIGQYSQIFYYEMAPLLFGYDNLVAEGILASDQSTFRDVYDSSLKPGVFLEALISLRWFHTFENGELGLYDKTGSKVGVYPKVDITTLSVSSINFTYWEGITLGTYRTPGAKVDQVIDPELSERALGPLQRSADATSSDLQKNRLMGAAPYVDYLSYCNGGTYDSFDSLKAFIDEESVRKLSELYTDVRDVDLVAGIWLEKLHPGSTVPVTFHCLFSKQMKHIVSTDRHWYERADRPDAYTLDQLQTISKASIARILCDNGDGVTEIQSKAFEAISAENPVVSCDLIPELDLEQWRDCSCGCVKL